MQTVRPYREIPNPQVRDAAIQFDDAFVVLLKHPPSIGILGALHCACIAMELYLKSVSAVEIEVPDSAFPGGSYIYAKAAAPSHVLTDLLKGTPADFQAEAQRLCQADIRLGAYPSFADALAATEGLFFGSRYPFEPHSDISQVPTHVLMAILTTLRGAVDGIRHRFEPV